DGPARLAEARRRRPGGSAAELVGDAETYLKFERPSLEFADAVRRLGRDVFAYRFDWQSPMVGLDSGHCLELPFVFNNPDAWTGSPMLAGADPAALAGLGNAMQSAWAAFVKTGRPQAEAVPDWPPYDETTRLTMCFDDIVAAVADPAGVGRSRREI
ncbi:MAG: carboxylesterase family protein, partial [Bauldia litoralis]